MPSAGAAAAARGSRAVRVFVAVLALFVTAGCGALTGRPLGTWAQDRAVTARVKARLAATDAVTLTRIHVDTYQSIVYLTGAVTSVDMKGRAETIARAVPGVEQVVNNLHLAGDAPVPRRGDVSASPRTDVRERPASTDEPGRRASGDGTREPGSVADHPIMRRFAGLRRVTIETGTPAWTRYGVYDARDRRVATLYSLSAVELIRSTAVSELAADESIEHVSIYRHGAAGAAVYDLVLWHVSRDDVALLE